jgi:hypothetical protein
MHPAKTVREEETPSSSTPKVVLTSSSHVKNIFTNTHIFKLFHIWKE